MTQSSPTSVTLPNTAELSATLASVAHRTALLLNDFVARQTNGEGHHYPVLDLGVVGRTFQSVLERIIADPTKVIETQVRFWQDYTALCQNVAQRALGLDANPVVTPELGDRRFRDEAWSDNPLFDYIKQTYLLAGRYIYDCVDRVEGLDAETAKRAEFWTRQFVDALAPTNFALTNPEVLHHTAETGGQNLLKGLGNLLDDLEHGKGKLKVKMTDIDKFELGRNVAVTPGKVVYQNQLMQLLQYTPTTETVYKRPLLIIPPWINKFYILDLRPENSFIKWAVERGHTVFVVSWVNPDARLADKSFEDYLSEGPLMALDAIEQATGEREVKALGYCLGGTLLACALAYLKAKGDDRIKAATFFTTMVDFAEPGELGVFIDEESLLALEREMEKTGYLDGDRMATTFNLMRANDLIWSFVINNYLLGRDPFPFDLLYWNSDSTRMPQAMHSFYLRNMYQRNLLCQAAGLELKGVPIDLRTVETPTYILATKEDHIAPWQSAYAATQLYRGPRRFVLAMSGHIAGVVNPPAARKYGYWVNEQLVEDPDVWLAAARAHGGSWWSDWNRWVRRYNGKKVPARLPGAGKLPVLEDAPGAYVKVRNT